MRKMLKNKKGFTLVELMIVVVIMGILVAVAIPIYGAVTDNAEKKTCADNRRTIQSMVTTYQMTGGAGGAQIPWADIEADDLTTNADFLAMFEGGEMPECPAGGTYHITVTPNATTGARDITVACLDGEAALHTNTDGSEVE